MDRKPIVKRKTAISYKTEEKTVLRGYNVSDLAEAGYTFYDALFILYQDRIPAENEADICGMKRASSWSIPCRRRRRRRSP